MEERTLEERLEDELKDQLADISVMKTGSEEKSEAIKGFATLYDKRLDKMKGDGDRKNRKSDRIVQIAETGLKFLGYTGMFIIGMNFEKTGTLTSNFFRNLIGKAKFMD